MDSALRFREVCYYKTNLQESISSCISVFLALFDERVQVDTMKHTNKAINALLALVVAVIAFHLMIIFKVIPYEITWGGRLKNDQEMYIFESISILINLLLGFVLMIKGRYISIPMPGIVISSILWFFLAVFLLNTLGNLFAKTNFEKSFSALTLLFAILIAIVIRDKSLQKG